jgi:GNAT superfamily N-acetyltransferase
VRIVKLTHLDDPSEYTEDVSTWMTDASSPYFPWLLGGEEATRRLVRTQLPQPVSEFSAEATYVLLEDDRCIGGFVALAGSAVARARRADLLAIVAGARAAARAAVAKRLEASRNMFLPVPSECFYLSRIGVLEHARGRGFGSLLLEEYLLVGSRNGFHRFRLDVSGDNAVATALFERHGFSPIKVESSRAVDFGYVAMEGVHDAG